VRIARNGVRTIIVETANRFARDLIVQETGYERLKAEGIELIAADSPRRVQSGQGLKMVDEEGVDGCPAKRTQNWHRESGRAISQKNIGGLVTKRG
jgi:hypothetical protein